MQDIERLPANDKWDFKDFNREPTEVFKHLEFL